MKRSASDRNSKMKEYEIVDTNAENIGGCGFCWYKAGSLGHRRKTDWLQERYAERLRFKVVRVGSAKASRELPTPYGMFSILYDGKLIAGRPIGATRFMSIMRRNAEQAVRGYRGSASGPAQPRP